MGVIAFGGGAMVGASGDAHDLMRNLSRTADGQPANEQGRPLPTGFVNVDTDAGRIYVNPLQVAYVCDENAVPKPPQL